MNDGQVAVLLRLLGVPNLALESIDSQWQFLLSSRGWLGPIDSPFQILFRVVPVDIDRYATITETQLAFPRAPRSLVWRPAPSHRRCGFAPAPRVHPVTGIQSGAVVDAPFDQEPTDSRPALRQRCFRLRRALRREVPDLRSDPLPADASHFERVVCLDPSLVSSDVHEFLELFECARALPPEAAIEVYEAALALYKGDTVETAG